MPSPVVAKPPPGRPFLAALLLLVGAVGILFSLIQCYNEFAGDAPMPLGKATVVRIDARPPYSYRSDRMPLLMCYPVFEYHDALSIKRVLMGKAAFPGYFEVGQEVPVGVIRNADNRVVVLDSWFRLQGHLELLFLASLFAAVGSLILTHPRRH